MSFHRDYEWQLRFLPVIKMCVGPYLLEPSSFDLDTQEATDLIVLRARDMRIGCRLRRAGYADRYPWEFTLRSHRDSGASTELKKIVEGWGDWLFYGHASDDEMGGISRWFIIDLSALRAHLIRNQEHIRPTKKSNGDGTHFVAFDLRKFPSKPSIVIASSHDIPIAPELDFADAERLR